MGEIVIDSDSLSIVSALYRIKYNGMYQIQKKGFLYWTDVDKPYSDENKATEEMYRLILVDYLQFFPKYIKKDSNDVITYIKNIKDLN